MLVAFRDAPFQRGYCATVTRLTPDQKVWSSNLSALNSSAARVSGQHCGFQACLADQCRQSGFATEPSVGFEPTTSHLLSGCSTNKAKEALVTYYCQTWVRAFRSWRLFKTVSCRIGCSLLVSSLCPLFIFRCVGCGWRSYRVECTGFPPTSEVKRRRARLVLGWGAPMKTSGCRRILHSVAHRLPASRRLRAILVVCAVLGSVSGCLLYVGC